MLCGTVISLLAASCAYAVESPVTPGPSVGHRPVINGLVLGTARGDISQNTVPLYVGEVISRTGGIITDVDGDPVKKEYCEWYRVDPNTQKEAVTTVGPCSYKLQAGDVGLKIRNKIRVISDPVAAAAKGLRLNPDESWPVSTLSANTVIAATPAPFPATTNLNTQKNPYRFPLNSGFPSTGFVGATFTIQVEGDANNNSQYDWSSNQPSWVNVSANGVVTFRSTPSTKTVRIFAAPKNDKSILYYKDITLNYWFINDGANKGDWPSTLSYCRNQGYEAPTRAQLFSTEVKAAYYGVRGVPGLWSEWGSMSEYSNTWGTNSSYFWTGEKMAVNFGLWPYEVNLTLGGVVSVNIDNWTGGPINLNRFCVKTL